MLISSFLSDIPIISIMKVDTKLEIRLFSGKDDMMKQKKRVWWSFDLWEANVFEQYLEEMAAQGWFLESVGGSVMKFHRAEPAKRRYAALLVPGSSSLTGADSWKAEQFRKQCQEAGWNFECRG